MNSFIIGIAGGSGSGKSTFANRLKEHFKDNASLIKCDNYYYPHDDLSFEQRQKLNYDAPEAIEFDLLKEHLESLKKGQDILCPVYDFARHTRSEQTNKIIARPIIILDGILILHKRELRDIMDMKIYVETDADERILRRVRRDINERGRDLDDVISQYLQTVKPMHNAYVEPTKEKADIIINGGRNEMAFDVVKSKIENLLKQWGNL